MILTKVCHEAKCDVCGEMVFQHYETQKDFINNLRAEGWSISNKRTVYSKCKADVVPTTIFVVLNRKRAGV